MKNKRRENVLLCIRSEKGSLALEQVLFIGAIVAMSVGLFAFYDNVRDYFTNFDLNSAALGNGPTALPGGTSN